MASFFLIARLNRLLFSSSSTMSVVLTILRPTVKVSMLLAELARLHGICSEAARRWEKRSQWRLASPRHQGGARADAPHAYCN